MLPYHNRTLGVSLTCLPPFYPICDNTTWIPNTINCVHYLLGSALIALRNVAHRNCLGPGTLPWNICDAIKSSIASDIAIAYRTSLWPRLIHSPFKCCDVGFNNNSPPLIRAFDPTVNNDFACRNHPSLKATLLTLEKCCNAISLIPFSAT